MCQRLMSTLLLLVAWVCSTLAAIELGPHANYFAPNPNCYDCGADEGPWCWHYYHPITPAIQYEPRNPSSARNFDYAVKVSGGIWPEDLRLVIVTPAQLRKASDVVPRQLQYESLEYLPRGDFEKQFLVRNAKPVCVGVYNPHANATVTLDLSVEFEILNEPYIDATVTLAVLLAVSLLVNMFVIPMWAYERGWWSCSKEAHFARMRDPAAQ